MKKKGNLVYLMADLQGEFDTSDEQKKPKAKSKAKDVVIITKNHITNMNCKCPQCGEMIFFDLLLNYTRCSNWRCDYRTHS